MGRIKTWIITTASERPIRDIADDLTKVGLRVERVLDEIGSITGSAADQVVAKLREVPGVIDVSPDISLDVGPPDKSDTW